MSFLPGMFPGAAGVVAAFPTVEATNTSLTASASTSHTVDLPADIVAGDLLIVLISANAVTFSATGWTQFIDFNTGNSDVRGCRGFYRVADGGEGASVTFTSSGSTTAGHNSYRISGYQGVPEATNQAFTGTDTSVDPPSHSASWGTDNNLWIAVAYTNGLSPTGYPANYAGITQFNIASAWRQLRAASEDPGVFTLDTAAQRGSSTIAVRPA